MAFPKLFTLMVAASTLTTASVLGQRYANFPVKRSEGTVAGAEEGISYFWNTADTSEQCPTLLANDLQTSLVQFDGLFPPEYDAGQYYDNQTIWNIGALYLSYPEGTFAFDMQFTTVTPNTTATWVNAGPDIANLWVAVREDVVNLWSQGINFQWIWYDVHKITNGDSNYAGQFQIQIQTPTSKASMIGAAVHHGNKPATSTTRVFIDLRASYVIKMISSNFRVINIQFEHYLSRYTLGVQDSKPRISWQYPPILEGFQQVAYEIEIFDENPGLERRLLCSTKVDSTESRLVPWPYERPLQSRQIVTVVVRVFGADGRVSFWSAPTSIEAGLLSRGDWICKRITTFPEVGDSYPQPEELFRKEFAVRQSILRARLYITAQGVYKAEINGFEVGDQFMAPGWTNYDGRLQYQTYDVGSLLSQGPADKCIGVRVAEGWYCGRLGFSGGLRDIWGRYPALLAQLEIFYDDGTNDIICSDETWSSKPGPTRLAEIYDGEKYDARLEIAGWSHPHLDERHWLKASVVEALPQSVDLVAATAEPVKSIQSIKPIKKISTPSGKTILDFGQNLVGYTRINQVKGERGVRGAKVSLHHAEVLENGELGRRPLRVCQAFDQYFLAPWSSSWKPSFTFHGYRYCQVDGWPSIAPKLEESLEAVVCHTDMEEAGKFECSDEMLNKLHENAIWSMRGNFLSIPTDCPQRDERLGWCGDIALFAPAATKLYKCYNILKNWLVDVSYEQNQRGGIPPFVSPNALNFPEKYQRWGKIWPCAIWHDVTTLVPWALYMETGDTDILARQYHSMTTWIESIPRDEKNNSPLWDPSGFQLGDWLDPSASPHKPEAGKTDPVLVADAFLINSLDIVTKAASILNKPADYEKYKRETENARQQFAYQYVTGTGRVVSDSQTAYALAICFNLLPTPELKMKAGERLAYIVRQNDFKIGTGFAGTPFICEALVKTDQADIAYSMLLNDQCPSWLYPVVMGATTIWERWDSMLPDGSINPGEMTSFNHYCFGAVVTFLHERLAGLQCVEAGWKRARAAPVPAASIRITRAHAEHQTPYGVVSCSWEINQVKETFYLSVIVPPTTTMEVVVPSNDGFKSEVVGPGTHHYKMSYSLKTII
ncbi:bacterial alpha-L-rhamnosidase-domain-containing protein [Xylogone sp. PMI_703]|nr:bacterial alpha-L-rhamnosidase-domain-containing protein [Xylogone sp. PMI_703]